MQIFSSGIDNLRSVDQLFVKQTVRGTRWGHRRNKKFIVKNGMGQDVFNAVECTSSLQRNFTNTNTAFNMNILDMHGRGVVHFKSSLRFASMPVVKVKLPDDQIIGYVKQSWAFGFPSFKIKNTRCETILRIEGPFNTFSFGGDVDFDIFDLKGTKIGKISKQWSGMGREFFTDLDYFGIIFPMNLDVYTKIALLGACMLIDATYYSR